MLKVSSFCGVTYQSFRVTGRLPTTVERPRSLPSQSRQQAEARIRAIQIDYSFGRGINRDPEGDENFDVKVKRISYIQQIVGSEGIHISYGGFSICARDLDLVPVLVLYSELELLEVPVDILSKYDLRSLFEEAPQRRHEKKRIVRREVDTGPPYKLEIGFKEIFYKIDLRQKFSEGLERTSERYTISEYLSDWRDEHRQYECTRDFKPEVPTAHVEAVQEPIRPLVQVKQLPVLVEEVRLNLDERRTFLSAVLNAAPGWYCEPLTTGLIDPGKDPPDPYEVLLLIESFDPYFYESSPRLIARKKEILADFFNQI